MITIWHNPRCSKSRQTLELLQGQGVAPTVRLYLEDAPNVDEIRQARDALGCRAVDMMRTGEALFKELDLKKSDDDETLIKAMAAHPKLIECLSPLKLCHYLSVTGGTRDGSETVFG